MPPRRRKLEDMLYPQIRHWLVDGAGRILACVIAPQQDDPEDSYDARLYIRSTDDEAYFISLDHAKAWAERETAQEWAAAERKKQSTATTASVEVQK
jgi:hypothetical protein